jgi:hypothetical protein
MGAYGVLLIVVLASVAQSTPREGGEAATLLGRVTTTTGCVLEQAVVTVADESGANPARATSGTAGEYRITRPEGGPVNVTVELTGFVTTRHRLDMFTGENQLDTALGLQVERTDPHRITGVVTTEAGASIAGATVSVLSAFNNVLVTQVRTDDRGRYSIDVYGEAQLVVTAVAVGRGAAARVVNFERFDTLNAAVNFTLQRRPVCGPISK